MRTDGKKWRSGWYVESVQELKRELDQVITLRPDIPSEPGGWWHQYVCPQHHTELLFDPLAPDCGEYACPYGCRLTGEPYRAAWLVFKHQAMARYALQAAAVYAATRETAYADLGTSIIVRYAERFPNYPVHPDAQPWMLKGRAFHQALTEAIWASTLLRAHLLLADEGNKLQKGQAQSFDRFLFMLESSMKEYHRILTFERGNPENNYTAWLNAALCCIYAVRGQKEELQAHIERVGGFRHHLSIAVRPDNFEFEGSTYYHLFVLRAYFIAAEMAQRFGIDLYSAAGDRGQTLQGMLDALLPLADRSGYLAALHDGPYAREPFAREIAEIAEIGLAKYGRTDYVPLLAQAYRQLYGSPRRFGLEAVVFGSGEWDLSRPNDGSGSLLLEDSGFAVLRQTANGLSCIVDFGPHGGSHGHYDKLNLIVNGPRSPLAPDRGTVPYGSPLKKMWYPATACHNTVTVGGRSQREAEGRCLRFEATEMHAYGWFSSEQAYKGCKLDRHLFAAGEFVLDWFTVELDAAEPRAVQWWFHSLGELLPGSGKGSNGVSDGNSGTSGNNAYSSNDGNGGWAACANPPAGGDGYSYIEWLGQWERQRAGEAVQLKFRQAAGDCLSVSLLTAEGSALYHVASPGTADDPTRPMHGIMHEQSGTMLHFVAAYRCSDEPFSLSWAGSNSDDAGTNKSLEVSRKDGKLVCRFALTDSGLKER
ncbi:heparinase II/III domain-containing protein [Paenibacillus beijingensis]|uniref:Uncharacterized protein n=1 Tax=Paenibacillus beijingensis TaxID=1126833 RepID=A0A0D5NKM4_9BACL|nr:heparinase II/III family protein [Paenibacillus beijingensis]AJY75801.1 hypothetical protein VN24_16145 [Paenibacillus beijingensis]